MELHTQTSRGRRRKGVEGERRKKERVYVRRWRREGREAVEGRGEGRKGVGIGGRRAGRVVRRGNGRGRRALEPCG